jgi:hypothetical protein
MDDAAIALHIASAIRRLLEFDGTDPAAPSFAEAAAELDPALYDPGTVADRELSAAWNFADSYFDAQWHRFPRMDALTWSEAEAALRETAGRLEASEPIEDPRVLAYAWAVEHRRRRQ